MTELPDDHRTERALAEDRTSAGKAESLRRSLATRSEYGPLLYTTNVPRTHRCLWVLLGALAAFFLLGAGTQNQRSEPAIGIAPPVATTISTTPATAGVRLIDLSGLSKERSKTMNRSIPLSVGIVSVGTLALFAALLVILYNGHVSAREQVNAGWAQVENVYQRRLDLVPLLVDAVQTYTDHEHETLVALTQARANAIQVNGAIGDTPKTVEQLKAIETAQGKVESALARLFAVVENYPQLKASRNYLSLQDQIEGTENRVTMERRHYNEFSRRYNTRLQTFPGNIVADMMGFEAKPYFQAETKALKGLDDPFGRHEG
jgi:LemA protein